MGREITLNPSLNKMLGWLLQLNVTRWIHLAGRQPRDLLGVMLLCLLILASCGIRPASDEEDPITAVVYAGFDPDLPFRRSEAWIPIRLELTNNLDPIKGELLVQIKDGTINYRMPVDLPTKSPKVYELPIYMETGLTELEFYVRTGGQLIPIELVTVSANYDETDRVIAVMSPQRGTHSHLAHRPQMDVEYFRRVIHTNPTFLPDYWVSYRNIDTLLWDAGPTATLTEGQQKSLDEWIQMGGTLVLAAGEFWQELSNSAFKLYVPMTLTGSEVLEENTPLNVKDSKLKPTINSKLIVATGELIDDPNIEVLIEANGAPFLIEREWGAGRIIFVASSLEQPLFPSPSELNEIFAQFITEPIPILSPQVVTEMDGLVTSFLRMAFQAELPSTWFIGIYLGCYILLIVPINYFVFKKIGRLEWAWLTVPVWAIIFAVGVYYIGALRQQSSVAVNEISIIESHPSAAYAQTTSYCSIYSPVRQWYDLYFHNPLAFPQIPMVQSMRGEDRLDETLNIRYEEEGPMVEDFLIYHWSQRLIKTQHTTPIGAGIVGKIQNNSGNFTGQLTNKTGFALKNPVIFTRNQAAISLKDMAPDETINIEQVGVRMSYNFQNELNQMRNMGWGSRTYGGLSRDIKFPSFVNDHLKKQYATSLLDYHINDSIAVLTAEVASSVFDFQLNDRDIEPNGHSLFSVIYGLSSNLVGEYNIDTNSWNFLDKAWQQTWRQQSRTNIRSAVPVRTGDYLEQISIDRNNTKEWSMVTDTPLKDGLVKSLRINVNYRTMFFGNMRQQNYGMGRMRMSPTGSSQWRSVFMDGTNHPKSEHQIQIENILTNEFDLLSSISDSEGWIKNPAFYVDRTSGRINLRMKTGTSWGVSIKKQDIRIHLKMDYGSEESDRFLGRMISGADESGYENEIVW